LLSQVRNPWIWTLAWTLLDACLMHCYFQVKLLLDIIFDEELLTLRPYFKVPNRIHIYLLPRWERARSKLSTSFRTVFTLNSFQDGKELVPSLNENTASVLWVRTWAFQTCHPTRIYSRLFFFHFAARYFSLSVESWGFKRRPEEEEEVEEAKFSFFLSTK